MPRASNSSVVSRGRFSTTASASERDFKIASWKEASLVGIQSRIKAAWNRRGSSKKILAAASYVFGTKSTA